MHKVKTNVIRLLEQAKINYEITTYEVEDGHIDGVSVALKTGKEVKEVYKTLVALGKSKRHYVFVIPVDEELDLKKASKAVGEKSMEMLPLKELQKTTGYIRGGCSPIGMKKAFPTVIDEQAKNREIVTVSGGKIGVQVTVSPLELADYIKAEFAPLTV